MTRTSPATEGVEPRSQKRSPLARRSAAVLTATALATAVLPLAGAQAAPTATAALTAPGTKVFPGIGEALTVNVVNSGARLLGETVNYVDIKLPNTAGLLTMDGMLGAPAGWTGTKTSLGGIQTYTFRGGSLAPGASAAFTFPVNVTAPLADRSGALEVAVSSDNGRTTSGAGPASALTTTVQTLEILAGSVKPTSPVGVTDDSGTAGQPIDYAFQVKNYAKAAQTVTPTLTSTVASDSIGQADAASILAGATQTFTSPVTLGAAGTRTFSGAAKVVGGPSVADTVASKVFTVQAPSLLDVDPAGFSPRSSQPGITRAISVPVNKTGAPALPGLSATLELLLDGTVLTTTPAQTVSYGSNANSSVLTFDNVRLPTLAAGLLDARYTFSGKDDNGFPFSYSETLNDVLELDAVAPVIARLDVVLPNDADGARQTAISNEADRVDVSGALAPGDCGATIRSLVVSGGGQSAPVTFTQNGCDFSGSFTTDRDAATPALTFPAGTTTFTVAALAADAADNSRTATVSGIVDIIAPAILSATTQAANATSSSAAQIAVQFNDVATVLGGCTPSQWRIDSEFLVTDVRFSDGSPCSDTVGKADNVRVLVLNAPRDQDLQTNVTYTPGTRPLARPAKDGAGQDALSRTIATISGVNPAAPLIQRVTRNGGAETATLDEGSYWTRIPNSSDTTVTFLNGRINYLVLVLDGDNKEIARKKIESSNDTSIGIPLPATDGTYVRKLQLVNGNLKSALTTLSITLDQVAPALGGVERVTGQARQVKVNFSEKLAGGTDYAEDWFASESNPQQDPEDVNDDFFFYQVSSVAGTGATRTLTTNSDLSGTGTIGALYNVRNPDAQRYVDRAGNGLKNTGGR